jgi:catechol 2,3-dioxygenase-like lactoylglutathione lyase family enzyme
VRIAFFLDPDGSLLEVVEDFVDYTDVVSPLRVLDERAAGLPATPRVDHVAVTVSDFASALEFYGERCGLERYAELADPEDARGLRLNYFWTSAIVLEVFSFQARTLPNPWRANTRSPGLSRLVFAVSDIEESRTLLRHNHTDGCHDSLTPPTRMVTDCDGTPIELVVR